MDSKELNVEELDLVALVNEIRKSEEILKMMFASFASATGGLAIYNERSRKSEYIASEYKNYLRYLQKKIDIMRYIIKSLHEKEERENSQSTS